MGKLYRKYLSKIQVGIGKFGSFQNQNCQEQIDVGWVGVGCLVGWSWLWVVGVVMGGSSRCSFISFFICEQNNAMLCLSVTPVLTFPIKPGEETIQIKRANC